MERLFPRWIAGPVLGIILLIPSGAFAQKGTVVFEDDFESAIRPEWSFKTVSTTPKGNRRFLGPLNSESVELNLKSLPRHHIVRLTFDAYALRSWDGNESGHGPDVLMVQSGDRRTLFATTFGIFAIQTFPGWFGIHSSPPYSGAKEKNSLGYTFNGEPRDAVYPIEIVFPHKEESLTLRFMMYGDGIITDEAWGLDNVKVTLDDTAPPTPAQMEEAWKTLESEDSAAAVKAVYTLASGEEQAVEFLSRKLEGRSIPFEPPGIDASIVRLRPRSPDPSVILGIASPSERQMALAAHALSLIGSVPARELGQKLTPVPADYVSAQLTVIDLAARQPIAHQPIRITGPGDPRSYPMFTDDQGQLTIKAPPNAASVSYSSPRRKYIPVSGGVAMGGQAARTITLDRGVPIGGIVMDTRNRPIAGATVKLEIEGNPNPNLWDPYAETDEKGRWSFDLAPRSIQNVAMAVFHPDFATASTNLLTMVPADIVQLKQATFKTTLRDGVAIEGTVVDSENKPIADAWIDWGQPRGAISPLVPPVTTDAQGRFRYTGISGQSVLLTAKATGYNVVQQSVRVGVDTTRITLTLTRSKGSRVKVVTPDGKPVYGARFSLGQWRGQTMYDIGFSTDREGRFVWDSVPDEGITGSLSLTGYPSQRVILNPGAEETVIAMQGPVIVRGKVADAESGQPISDYRISYSMVRGTSSSGWQIVEHDAKQAGFEFRVTTTNIEGVIVKIEANGYLATQSELIPVGAISNEIQIKLFTMR